MKQSSTMRDVILAVLILNYIDHFLTCPRMGQRRRWSLSSMRMSHYLGRYVTPTREHHYQLLTGGEVSTSPRGVLTERPNRQDRRVADHPEFLRKSGQVYLFLFETGNTIVIGCICRGGTSITNHAKRHRYHQRICLLTERSSSYWPAKLV